ncbi:MAG: NnrS family protein [Gammaproteobacteria bacterium]|nr:NnrS family protein [Gammaproteobacteria bacterium]
MTNDQYQFSAAPHRMMFFGGMLQLLLTIGWWLFELLGRYTEWLSPLPLCIPGVWAHAFLMLYSLAPFFILGFLMTTYPRWMGGREIPRSRYTRVFFLLISAVALIYVGLLTDKYVLAAGVALLLAGWIAALYALLQVYFHAPTKDKYYERVLNAALAAGCAGMFSYLLWLLSGEWLFLSFAMHGGLWLFLMPVMIAVCHRMIPFFSSCVLADYSVVQPKWSLPLTGICVAGHTVLAMQNLIAWLFIFDIPLMFLAFHHSLHWGLRRSLEVRLLAVLHIAFLWLGIALLLYNVQSLTALFSGQAILGRAPLHALAIGFMTSLLVGMASRVMRGHSGRPLIADGLTWVCFLGISAAALLRILAEMPGAAAFLFGINLHIAAAATWLFFLSLWAIRYLPMGLLARADGKPG